MGGSRVATSAALMLLLPWTTLAASSEPGEAGDNLVVPAPRAGDLAFYQVRAWNEGSTGSVLNVTLNWTGAPRNVTDGWGAVHRAYPLKAWACDNSCWGGTYFHDLDTRATISTVPGPTPGAPLASIPIGSIGLRVDREGQADVPLRRFYSSVYAYHALQGRELGVGETIVATSVHAPGALARAIALTGAGWEDAGFRVDGVQLSSVGNFTLWYDGASSIPVRYFARSEVRDLPDPGDFFVLYNDWRRTGFVPGDGAALVEEGYQAPSNDTRAAPRAAISLDGPQESMSAAFPLPSAVASLRLDPRADAWFVVHPSAVLRRANFYELPQLSGVPAPALPVTWWFLTYVDADGSMEALVSAPYTPGVSAPAGSVIQFSVGNGRVAQPPPASAACAQAASEAARAEIPLGSLVTATGGYAIDDAGRVVCHMRLRDAVPEPTTPGPWQLRSTQRAGEAHIEGQSGGLTAVGGTITLALTATVDPDLDPSA